MKKMISRRNFLAAAGVVAAAGVLTACGGSSNSTAASASTAASGAAASGDTIKVGVLGPLTGDVSVYGQAVVNGATLYLKQVNEKGGINGKQLEIIAMDEQGDATQAVTCFTKMCDQGITALWPIRFVRRLWRSAWRFPAPCVDIPVSACGGAITERRRSAPPAAPVQTCGNGSPPWP